VQDKSWVDTNQLGLKVFQQSKENKYRCVRR